MLDGVPTTHYQAVIPASRLVGAHGAQAAAAEKSLGLRSLTIDYWTDSSLRLSQLRFEFIERHLPSFPAATVPTVTTSVGSTAHSVTMIGHRAVSGLSMKLPLTFSIDVRISRYGIPVDVHAPAASQITGYQTCQATSTGTNCESSG